MSNEHNSRINEITAKDRRSRLLEIVRIMRSHDFIHNFSKQTNPKEVRLALEELGPTFIKGGQILSTRPDLISPSFIAEFSKLQDDVEIDSFASMQQTFKEQTGEDLSEAFASFEEHPFASASIGQTHRAVLKDGTQVVVKIQHPKVQELVETDLALFRQALRFLKFIPDISVIDPKEILNELQTSLLNEIDTSVEIKNSQAFYRLNNDHDIIKVPKVYTKYSTQKILVTSQMKGQSIKKLADTPLDKDEATRQEQLKVRKYVAKILVQNFIKQVFVDNFFHADPHPGNILFYNLPKDDHHVQYGTSKVVKKTLGKVEVKATKQHVLPPYRIVYLDFGMMGHLTPMLADGIAKIVIAIVGRDIREIGQAILAVCNRTGKVDPEDFYAELGIFLEPYLKEGLGQIDFPSMLYQIIELCRKNHLQVKPEVTLLVKAFGSLEGLVAQLDPDMSLMDVARPFTKDYLKRKLNLKTEAENTLLTLAQIAKATPQLPIKLNQMLDILTQGQGRLTLKLKGQDRLLDRIEVIVNRIIITIILAAIIMSSSLLVQGSAGHPAIYNIGVGGYLISFMLILFLAITSFHDHFKKR